MPPTKSQENCINLILRLNGNFNMEIAEILVERDDGSEVLGFEFSML
jgi:hypothetical protein